MKTFTIANPNSSILRPRAEIPGAPGDDMMAFAAKVREELNPEGALETLLVERIIRAVERLQPTGAAGSGEPFDAGAIRGEAQAERTLFRALDAFQTLRDRRGPRWGKVSPSASVPIPDDGSVELPAFHGFDDWSADEDPDQAGDLDADRWEDRLVIDPEVSETSPVVRETWITVRHVISLIVDGASWADILRSHPELTEADIRACLAYAIEEEGGILQF